MFNLADGPRYKYLTGRTLVNHGTASLSDVLAAAHTNYSSLVLTAGAGIENFGTFEIRDGRDLVDGGGAGAVVNHAGAVLRVSPGPRATIVEAPTANAGTIEVAGGYLAFRAGYAQTAGTLRLNGDRRGHPEPRGPEPSGRCDHRPRHVVGAGGERQHDQPWQHARPHSDSRRLHRRRRAAWPSTSRD